MAGNINLKLNSFKFAILQSVSIFLNFNQRYNHNFDIFYITLRLLKGCFPLYLNINLIANMQK